VTTTLNGKGVHHTGGLPAPVSTPAPAPTSASADHGRLEGVVQVLIMLAVAGMAGAASFRHVHDWTMHNSPAGTGDWFGWANAMVSELIPLAAGLEARRRHRLYGAAGIYPIALILGAVALSLTGQFAEAKPGLSGWVISAVPALGFLALVKLVLSGPATSTATGTGQNADTDHADRPAATTPTITELTTGPVTASTASTEPTHIPTEETSRPEVPAHLLPSARFAFTQHEQATGRPITADELAVRMSVTPTVAGQLLTAIGQPTTPAAKPTRINGAAVAGGAR
jgi:hypothetical protein